MAEKKTVSSKIITAPLYTEPHFVKWLNSHRGHILFKPAERSPQQKGIQQSNPRKSDDKPYQSDDPEIDEYGKRARQCQNDQEQHRIGKRHNADDKRIFQRVFDGIFKPGNIRENVYRGK